MSNQFKKGFTLIELMIVVAIIGILATIAIPSYNRYVIRTQNNSCLMEVKAYTQLAINTINDGRNVSTPSFGACTFITDASSWTVMNTISGISPGDRNTTCAPNGTCTLD